MHTTYTSVSESSTITNCRTNRTQTKSHTEKLKLSKTLLSLEHPTPIKLKNLCRSKLLKKKKTPTKNQQQYQFVQTSADFNTADYTRAIGYQSTALPFYLFLVLKPSFTG